MVFYKVIDSAERSFDELRAIMVMSADVATAPNFENRSPPLSYFIVNAFPGMQLISSWDFTPR
jgi:hypothetical protein